MKFGHIIINYYNNSFCTGNYSQTNYSIEDDDKIYILKKESVIVSYPFSFDFFSTTIYYSTNENEEEDDEDEDDTRKGILCNGQCYTKKFGDDILIDKGVELAPLYDEEFKLRQYYSCVFNNIIKNATITIERFSDSSCKTAINGEVNTFYGNQSCWDVKANYSFRPLYYEDNNERIYYHAYNLNNCISEVFSPFIFNENYFTCDLKCRQQKDSNSTYYKCKFSSGKNLFFSKILYLYLILYIFIFII